MAKEKLIMLTGTIILLILSLMALIGIGNSVVKDFKLPSVVLSVLFALAGGLNFIPQIRLGNFYFSIGTAVLYLTALFIWIFKGKIKNRLICLLVTIVLSGVLYGATRIGAFYNYALWKSVNIYYALAVGIIAFALTRNAKYGFTSSVIAIGTAGLLTMIGSVINLDATFTPAVIAGTAAMVFYAVVAKIMPSRPNKATYYFETGRMTD